ncbi:UDP-2,3-diacylglucosamine diphosphatase [Phaeocystidibacter marisrubri]|uniref:UDP-2,3-diacylglucosamine diphosphatase n=1 Tax=Phaeocystidibacter marisrubri TaxID=1577780 RepID=A0A6L3ZIN3_9FLAO|nr:UDP-2,3-diacylglucosamine diphosphatase [Phaeocystidibacter marisrubri]KAB2817764.1 UDP-2,3-diacylglucosamine diphosphatase [Phaeocystidibacter marisrubri]
MRKRIVDTVVISDVHLGTYGCHAKELHQYLRSIKPRTLVLNGDIIDIWNFRKRYFPKSHLRILKRLLHMASKGTDVYYLTGNHDELLRRFADYDLGKIHLRNKLVLEKDGSKMWIFHGDIFDASIQNARWLAKLGGWGYDMLILINRWMNYALEKMGREKYSLSKKIKNSVKKAVKYITDFEDAAAELAVDQGYDYVICGHIHQPQMREVETKNGKTMYLNSGDWVENCTALEYNEGKWTMYQHDMSDVEDESQDVLIEASPKAILAELLKETQIIESA